MFIKTPIILEIKFNTCLDCIDMIFLLGAYDLEMKTIQNILDCKNIKYFNKQLSWGAKLSAYENELNDENMFYAIELEEDIKPPKNYHSIEHHNDKNNQKSSLEQVADILGITLTRYQQLVALNDSRYIDGMRSICATNEEIEYIRSLDRKMQGVTQEDEFLAQKSISNSNGLNIIFSFTNKFSAISDKIYKDFENYIIYNENSLIFYGYEIKELLSFLESQNIKKEHCYYGGGEFGFLGIKKDILSSQKIKTVIEEFQEYNQKDEIISHHTFMFPFIFSIRDKEKLTENWEFQKYDKKQHYNEEAYFHSFFKDSMFTQKETDNSSFYQNKKFTNKPFFLTTSKKYELTMKRVTLKVFSTGVAILCLDIENKKYADIKSILEINEFTRRLYPEYLDAQNNCTLTPRCVEFDKETENFTRRDKEIKISEVIKHILDTSLDINNKEVIRPAVDGRMFVMSFYKNKKFSNALKGNYETNDKWYEYVFVDSDGKTVQNLEMQKELTKKASYARWQDYGTMYGVSKYSFVCVSDSDFVLAHMKTVYFEMFNLLLMLRATILKFSTEVSDTANEIENKNIAKDVNELYKRYIKFVNNFYFREITAKDQGLELYEKAIGILNIERDIKDLDAEIEELHKFVEIQTQNETASKMNFITWIGGILLPASVITSYLGMNSIKLQEVGVMDFPNYLVIGSLLIMPLFIGLRKICRKCKWGRKKYK